jgi:hypothetical protein
LARPAVTRRQGNPKTSQVEDETVQGHYRLRARSWKIAHSRANSWAGSCSALCAHAMAARLLVSWFAESALRFERASADVANAESLARNDSRKTRSTPCKYKRSSS